MRTILLFTLFLTLLNTCAQEKQVIIESEVTEIAFNNPYKFNSTIENRLKNDSKSWTRQAALLSYQKKGEYKKTLKLFALESDKKPQHLLQSNKLIQLKPNTLLLMLDLL
jgi:hypothetical protein